MNDGALSTKQTQSILDYLGVAQAAPGIVFLEQLIGNYAEMVPWETASRIVRRANVIKQRDCPRWAAEFWELALEKGTGGTCFESNGAFAALLRSLGFECYLTLNNMVDLIGCHTAIVVNFPEGTALVDAGYPLYRPVWFRPNYPVTTPARFHNYTMQPDGDDIWQVERDQHPQPNVFTFVNRPIPLPDYNAATINDYHPIDGLFLHRLIINLVIGDYAYRFDTQNHRNAVERYRDGAKEVLPFTGDTPTMVADLFGVDYATIAEAWQILQLDQQVE